MSASKIGPYEIKNTLRHDRQYSLFAAYDPRVREDVVLKLWRKEQISGDFATRVQREAEIINGLNHPAIVPIWGFGDLGGNPYIATLEMAGGTLADRLKKGPLSTEQAEQNFLRLAQAVEALHERDIVHGHIQPQHILFDARGDIYLAWVASLSSQVDFASPEQNDGQAASKASDVFSLGALLLYLFTGKTLDTVKAEELPEPYIPLLDRALYETPQDRFGSVRELIAAFKSPAKPLAGSSLGAATADDEFDFANWGLDDGSSQSVTVPPLPLLTNDDPFAAWGEDFGGTSASATSSLGDDDDPFAAFGAAATPPSRPAPPTPPKPSTDPDAEMMSLFDFGEDEYLSEAESNLPAAATRQKPQQQFVYDPGPGESLDEPFPDWLEGEIGNQRGETLLPALDQFMADNQVQDKRAKAGKTGKKEKTRPRSRSLDPQTRRLILVGGAVFLILLCLIPLAVAFLPGLLEPQVTIIATAPAIATATPTQNPNLPPPTATPTPSIQINSPLPDTQIDLGEVVTINITITDMVGLRAVSILVNEQLIGNYTVNGDMVYSLTQEWVPDQGGNKRLSIIATNRNGDTMTSETILIRVVDQTSMELNGPIWARIESNVSAIRELDALKPVVPDLLGRTELIQRYQTNYFTSYTREDANQDVLVFYAFDFVARDYDLYLRYSQYLGENVGGYYDPATEEFVVVNRGETMTPLGQLIYAHEFMHALQDQHFQLDILTETSLTTDANLALRGLAEGEAELVQNLYLEGAFFTPEEQVELFNESNIGSTQDTTGRDIPLILVAGFYFPYDSGGAFVNYLYERGGWAAINQAWANPPQSTEQIYHPERYVAGDVPQIVTVVPLTDTLGADWQLVRQETAGEFFIRQHLTLQLGAEDAEIASTGWGGDQFAVYWNASVQDIVVLFRATWDTAGDAAEFAAAYGGYNNSAERTFLGLQADGSACWQSTDVVCLYALDTETLVVRAPSLELAGVIAAAQLADS
ncbi:MAG: serine/threonine protein kinase [Chloroflexi bacterium]|nr:serine/threonine protein kinase [Chloroflexota bacterium]